MINKSIFIITLCLGIAVWCDAVSVDKIVVTDQRADIAGEFHVATNGNDSWSGTQDAPFASVERAQAAVRKLLCDSPTPTRGASVILHEGTYSIERPLVFTSEDSGSERFPVVYRAADGERPILSGGRKISQTWTAGSNGIWTVEIPEVRSGEWRFRHLYVNGESRPRAKNPNNGFFRVASFPDHAPKPGVGSYSRFGFKESEISSTWKNPQDAVVVLYNYWTDYHLPIESVDNDTSIVTFAYPSKYPFLDGNEGSTNGARFIVENFLEVLDEPGEWYLDYNTGVLSYWPKAGEDLSRAEVIVPVLPALIEIRGNASNGYLVKGLRFYDITFEHTNFQLPAGNVNFQQGASTVPGAVMLAGAQDIQFEHCSLRNLGGFAFEIKNGCKNDKFIANDISHIAAGGFKISGASQLVPPVERTSHLTITDNVVEYFGETYASAVGICVMNASECLIAHNHVHHGYYTGISVGWKWGYMRSVAWGNRIEFNNIHDIGQHRLSDLGGIYTLGVSPGTSIRNNLIHGVTAGLNYSFGIYCDEGTTHLLCEDNVVYDIESSPFHINYGKEVWVKNNIFALGNGSQISLNHPESHESVFFEGNIVYWTNNSPLFNEKWRDARLYSTEVPWKGSSKLSKSTGFFNWNIYFNPDLPRDQVLLCDGNWDQWQSRDKDKNSLYIDPLFIDPVHGNFSLKPESPAFKFGFQQIDMSDVGPRVTPGVRRSLQEK